MHKCLLVVFATACVMRHQPPPAPPFQYGPELREIADAIEDLKNGHDVKGSISEPIHALENALQLACGTWKVSCEPAHWLPAYDQKGDSGTSIAHALGDIDRAYSAFWAERVDLVTTQLEDARRGVRELLVRRERLDTRLPENRQLIFAREDLQYVRVLIAGQMPPAEAAWDYDKGIAELDAAIATIDAADLDPDRAHVAMILPNPGDFAALPYRDRMNVAYDVLHRISDDLTRDRKSGLERKQREQLAAHLMSLRSALGHAKNSGTVRS